MAKKNRNHLDLRLVIILYANNKKSLNSIFKKIGLNKFSNAKVSSGKTFLVSSLDLKSLKNVVLSYIEKENFYHKMLGLNYNSNYLSFDFFSCNFLTNKFNFKNVILYTVIYKSLAIFCYNVIFLLNIYYIIYSNLNLFLHKCLQ